MKRWDQRRNLGRCRRRARTLRVRSGRHRRFRWRCWGRGFGLWADSMPRLRCGSLRCAGAQLLARGLAGPGTRVDIAHHAQPFLGFRLGGKEPHVQAEALATLFEATAHEKGEALELGELRLCERHRRRRRAQIEHERSCLRSRPCRMVCVRLGGRQICRWYHKFPGTVREPQTIGVARSAEGECERSHRCAIVAAPPS